MTTTAPRIAQFLGLSEAELMRKALRNLLLEQRRTVSTARHHGGIALVEQSGRQGGPNTGYS